MVVGIVVGVIVVALLVVGVVWMTNRTSGTPQPAATTASKGPNPIYTPRPTSSAAPTQSSTAGPTAPGTGGTTAGIGQTVTLTQDNGDSVEYTVTGPAQTATSIASFYTPDPGRTFVIVDVTMTLISGTIGFADPNADIMLMGPDGTTYETDSGAEMFYTLPDGSDNPLWAPTLSGGHTLSGALIFAVDQSNVSGSVLVIGVGSAQPVTVGLGL